MTNQYAGEGTRVMRLVHDDILERVEKALQSGETGDMDVIYHLSKNDLVDTWTRESTKSVFGNAQVFEALEAGADLRPLKWDTPPASTSNQTASLPLPTNSVQSEETNHDSL